jgi:hypothetical protein
LLRNDRWCVHRGLSLPLFLVFLGFCCHLCRHRLFLPWSDFGPSHRPGDDRVSGGHVHILMQVSNYQRVTSVAGF